MGLNLAVIGVSFLLYYMGFFGTTEGPLSPDRIGETIAAAGVTRGGFLGLTVATALGLLCWNWIYNLGCFVLGRRLICTAMRPDGDPCGCSVSRAPLFDGVSSRRKRYVCRHGHRCATARFLPVRKGLVANTLLAVAVMLSGMVGYCL